MPKIEVSTGNPVVALSGEIDMTTAEAMTSALEPWVRAGGPLTLDVSEVTFIDSTALHALVKAAKSLGERGCIIVHGAHGSVLAVLQMTKLDEALENVHFIPCLIQVPAAGSGTAPGAGTMDRFQMPPGVTGLGVAARS